MVPAAHAHKDDIYNRIRQNDERFGTVYFDPGLRIEWILELKYQREAGGLSKHQLDSATIYKGVLCEGKVNIEDF